MKRFLYITILLLTGVITKADVKLPSIIGSNMVIQRETMALIWGWADPGEKVKVTSSWGVQAETLTEKSGKWNIKLNTPKSGGPFTITVQGKNKIELTNILSGDVWLCSGQSNMQFNMKNSEDAAREIPQANYPEIRLFRVSFRPSITPCDDTPGHWVICSPETVKSFSAVGYYFGRDLYKAVNIPMGLINVSFGGTNIESWTALSEQMHDPAVKAVKNVFDKRVAEYAAAGYDRATLKKDSLKAWNDWRAQMAEYNKSGKKGKRPVYKAVYVHPYDDRNYPGILYNGMINPLVPFAIKGAIWYQGENNAGNEIKAEHYRIQLERMIKSWRKVWNCGEFPFYFVQLPNFGTPWQKSVEDSGWPIIRESFLNTAKEVPNTGMAVTIDLGKSDDIHPKNKKDVGDRLARLALYNLYNKKDIVWTGPIPQTCKFNGGQAVVKFETGGSPLAVKGNKLYGFALVGENDVPIAADAKIAGGNTVVVSSSSIKKARKVYYAWAKNPVGANLVNEGGLPASPFRFEKASDAEKKQPE